MEKSFSWQSYDRMARVLESMGYVVAFFGPLIGVGLLIFGSSMLRITGFVVIFASVLVAMYHLSFSLLMNGLRELSRTAPSQNNDDKPSVTAADK